MSDNTFWVLVWSIVASFYGVTSYFEEQTKQDKIKSDNEIAKIKEETNRMFGQVAKDMAEGLK